MHMLSISQPALSSTARPPLSNIICLFPLKPRVASNIGNTYFIHPVQGITDAQRSSHRFCHQSAAFCERFFRSHLSAMVAMFQRKPLVISRGG